MQAARSLRAGTLGSLRETQLLGLGAWFTALPAASPRLRDKEDPVHPENVEMHEEKISRNHGATICTLPDAVFARGPSGRAELGALNASS